MNTYFPESSYQTTFIGRYWSVFAILLGGLGVLGWHHFLLFHTLVEMFIVLMGLLLRWWRRIPMPFPANA